MALRSNWLTYKWILAIVIACLCIFPAIPSPADTFASDATAKYTSVKSEAVHIVSYRPHFTVKFLKQKLQVSMFMDKLRDFQHTFAVPLVTFLFVIQTLLKWILLMPIRYGSIFIGGSPYGTHDIPERGKAENELHQTRCRDDSENGKGFENICIFHRARGGGLAGRQIFPGLTYKSSPDFWGGFIYCPAELPYKRSLFRGKITLFRRQLGGRQATFRRSEKTRNRTYY
ncbi:hypothetical protein [Brevibacillus borstelensis]|uniref:hypothetical protein n=1 Tax=Brevibacillus borstelensis TaxID=45462 RepID=UPI0030BE5858